MEPIIYKTFKDEIDISTVDALCKTISMIEPYVAPVAINHTLIAQQLEYYSSVNNRIKAYKKFYIPKKSGGHRTILAPDGDLKNILTTLHVILSILYTPNDSAMGFVDGRSIVDNAKAHLNHNYVLNLDLSNFFPSISANMVEHSLVKSGLNPWVARLIASISTYPQKSTNGYKVALPQGAPTSPTLSNIYCQTLDRKLAGLANRFHLVYTRYADDMTFSSNHNVYQEEGEFMVELRRIISECHLTINEQKTRLQKRGGRQEVTGLTIGEKVNVSRKYIKNLRAAIHHLKKGKLSHHSVRVVLGKLNFLRMVKGSEDPTYRKLCIAFNITIKGRFHKKKSKK